jgi:hypothetical protein
LWEGAVLPVRRKGEDKLKMSSAELLIEPAKQIDETLLYATGLRLAKVAISAIPPHVRRALEWLTLARSARAQSERFMHLWLAILTVACHGQRKHGDDMRITTYTRTMINPPFVLSPLAVSKLNQRLNVAKKVRHDLLHRADDSGITAELLSDLEATAFTLMDFELTKIGTPISA